MMIYKIFELVNPETPIPNRPDSGVKNPWEFLSEIDHPTLITQHVSMESAMNHAYANSDILAGKSITIIPIISFDSNGNLTQ